LLCIIASAGIAGDDYSLLASGKIERGQFHDLSFVNILCKKTGKVSDIFTTWEKGAI
jgi:hypothetical protein